LGIVYSIQEKESRRSTLEREGKDENVTRSGVSEKASRKKVGKGKKIASQP